MQQIYHSNAKTNVNIREQIQNKHSSTNKELAVQYVKFTSLHSFTYGY
ncbi:MAG: hypothetical protein ACOYMA_21370 [Bacteroidia bacterium]